MTAKMTTTSKPIHLHLVSLGCAKNLVDSEVILGRAGAEGFRITSQPGDADVLMVNTCAFIDEARAAGVTSSQMLVCCGGGGLTSGIALALAAEAPDIKVHPVEPEGFDDVTRSLATGAVQRNTQLTGSICDAILTPAPGEMTFPILNRLCGTGLTITDDQALHAMAAAFTHLRVVAEPGGAAALAAALFGGDGLTHDTVIVTISGGNVDPAVFRKALDLAERG